MEVRDLWPESIAAVGAMDIKSLQYKFLEKLEYHLYRSAGTIVTVTDSFKKILVDNNIESSKIEVVKNGVLLNNFQPVEKDENLVAELGLQNKFVIGYIGTHGMAHGLDFIVKVAPEIKDSSIHLILLGDGAEKKNLLDIAKKLAISNLTFLPFVKKNQISRYISVLDVALVNLRKADTFKTVIPSKIFENASMLKPILLGVEGESKKLIEFYNAGVCFEPENKLSLVAAINKIRIKKNYIEYQQGARKLSEDFDRKRMAQVMLGRIKKEINK
jgi:glycosyltransferase involved in cell wall biosynthesis